MLTLPLSVMSPAGSRSRLSILIFHRVLPAPDELLPDEPDAAAFERQIRWVRDWFNVLPLDEAVERLYCGELAPRALAITFDDGYADNAEVAAPVLQRLGLCATFFIATGFLDGGCMFNDRVIDAVRRCRHASLDLADLGLGRVDLATLPARRDAIRHLLESVKHRPQAARTEAVEAIASAAGVEDPPSLMMSTAQVRGLLARGMQIGAHTRSHPILTRLTDVEAETEIASGKQDLEAMIGARISLFAYPNGVPDQDYAARHADMVRGLGFSAAVSTAWGAASTASDRFQLPRFTPWDRQRLRYGARLLVNLGRRERLAA